MIKRIANKAKSLAIDLTYQLNLLQVLIGKNHPHRILMYHGVMPREAKKFNARHQYLNDFVKQIKYLKKHCHIIPVVDYFDGKFLPGKQNIAITFDDGYLNNYLYAFPVLEDLEVPATFYITGLNNTETNILWADYLEIATQLTNQAIYIQEQKYILKNNIYIESESQEPLYSIIREKDFQFKNDMIKGFEKHIPDFRKETKYDNYWKLMTDDQITEVGHSKFVKIGSHGYFHNNLGEIGTDNALQELASSKAYLEKLVPYNINEVAYPDGSYTREVVIDANKIGFNYQLAVSYHYNEDKNDKILKDRFGIYPCVSNANQIVDALLS